MKKILLGCALALFTITTFAATISIDTSHAAIQTSQSDQITEFNEQVYYVLLSSDSTAEDLNNNLLLKNIKMEKSPLPLKPVETVSLE